MRISVIGCGYLGAVHAAAMAKLGHDVVGVDVDAAKVDDLANARAPFFEPGLPELLEKHLATGRLRFSTDLAGAAAWADVHFICVGTPQMKTSHAANLSYVESATSLVARNLTKHGLIVGKSTVPVGTAARLRSLVAGLTPAGIDAELVWNPEFLREGKAVHDTLHPDRIVLGGTSPVSEATLREVYATPIAEGTPVVVTDLPTAELVKVSANAFLATKISFINAMAEVCEASGADVVQLADAIGYDGRIGRRFLNAGLGFGGGCLPKDIRAFMARAGELGADQALAFLREIDSINMRRRVRMVDLAREVCGGSIVGRRIAVLGLAFKPNSDDIRDSPALNVAAQMQLQGASVVVTDPQALENAQRKWPDLRYAATADEAATGVDLVLLLTEWDQYRSLDPVAFGAVVAQRRMLDGRNALDPAAWRAAGWTYRALGRP